MVSRGIEPALVYINVDESESTVSLFNRIFRLKYEAAT